MYDRYFSYIVPTSVDQATKHTLVILFFFQVQPAQWENAIT